MQVKRDPREGCQALFVDIGKRECSARQASEQSQQQELKQALLKPSGHQEGGRLTQSHAKTLRRKTMQSHSRRVSAPCAVQSGESPRIAKSDRENASGASSLATRKVERNVVERRNLVVAQVQLAATKENHFIRKHPHCKQVQNKSFSPR